MDKIERLKFKQMAVDAIVKYPYGHPCVELAEALEKCLDWMTDLGRCDWCSLCDDHVEEK